jgi:hypothetical protein
MRSFLPINALKVQSCRLVEKEEPKRYTLTLVPLYLDFKLNSNQVWTCTQLSNVVKAAMDEWLRCSAHIHKVLCSNLGTISYGMTLDKSLTAVCLGSPVR